MTFDLTLDEIEDMINWNLSMGIGVVATLQFINRLDLLENYLWWQFPSKEKVKKTYKKKQKILSDEDLKK